MTEQQFARWYRAARVLARLPDSVTGGVITEQLLTDLVAVAGGEADRGRCPLRVVVLWAPGDESRLIEALLAARLPGFGLGTDGAAGMATEAHLPLRITPKVGPARLLLKERVGARCGLSAEYVGFPETAEALRRRAAENAITLARYRSAPDRVVPPYADLEIQPGALAPQALAAPVTLVVLPVVSLYGRTSAVSSMAATIRDELAGAHAVLGVAGYQDVIDTGQRGPFLEQLRDWLAFARRSLPADRVTLVIDSWGHARGDLADARAYARQQAKRMMTGTPPWLDDAIAAVDSRLALTAVEAATGDDRVARHWEVSGLPGLLDAIITPLAVDPAETFISGTASEFRAACATIQRRSEGILAVHADPARDRLPLAQRRARLGALAAAPLVAGAVGDSLGESAKLLEAVYLDELEDGIELDQALTNIGVEVRSREGQQRGVETVDVANRRRSHLGGDTSERALVVHLEPVIDDRRVVHPT